MDRHIKQLLIQRGYLATKEDLRSINAWLKQDAAHSELQNEAITQMMQERRDSYVKAIKAFEKEN